MKRFALMMTMSAVAVLSMTNARAESNEQVKPACAARLLSAATSPPADSQDYTQSGTVIVAVSVDRDGAVKAAEIRRSSGSRKLDDAATRSALAAWKFASSNCEGTAYPLQQSIAVRYEQRPVYTFSAMRAHAWRKNLQSAIARGCAVTRIDNGVVTSCITPADAQDRQMADL